MRVRVRQDAVHKPNCQVACDVDAYAAALIAIQRRRYVDGVVQHRADGVLGCAPCGVNAYGIAIASASGRGL